MLVAVVVVVVVLYSPWLLISLTFLIPLISLSFCSLEHSNIIYEDPAGTPLLRLCWNQQDNNYLAVILMIMMDG